VLFADEILRTVGEGTFGKVTECRDLQKSVIMQQKYFKITIIKNSKFINYIVKIA